MVGSSVRFQSSIVSPRPSKRLRRRALPALLAFSLGGLCGPARAGFVDPAVRTALAREGKAVACVELFSDGGPADPLRERCEKHARAQERFLARFEGLARGTAFRVRHRYHYSPVVLVELRGAAGSAALDALAAAPEVKKVHPDRATRGGLAESVPYIGADRVHDAGNTGAGKVVAVFDTGVDSSHPDLEDAVIHTRHFLGGGTDEGEGAADLHGHGTHVSGIVASRGRVAPTGVAPGASIVMIQVLDGTNRGVISDWTRGVEYVNQLHEEPDGIRIDAMNMSLVSDEVYTGLCDDAEPALAAACAAAVELGIAVFGCGGNTGGRELPVPGCFSSVISVGSVLDEAPDVISGFTTRNAQLDLLAPGQDITSCRRGGGTAVWSGCSMATPHAAGVACLLREIDPGIPPGGIQELMEATGVLVYDFMTARRYPRLDAAAAVERLLTADCDQNGTADYLDLRGGASADCDRNGVPDECDVASGRRPDCNGNGVPDGCDVASGASPDLEGDGVPDECVPFFHRGDPNHDGEVDLSDAIFLFEYLYLGGPRPTCAESADSNNDAELDLSDPIFLLAFVFLGDRPPDPPGPPPGPCGQDVDPYGSAFDIGCEVYAYCGGE